jgi:hypothetical protein
MYAMLWHMPDVLLEIELERGLEIVEGTLGRPNGPFDIGRAVASAVERIAERTGLAAPACAGPASLATAAGRTLLHVPIELSFADDVGNQAGNGDEVDVFMQAVNAADDDRSADLLETDVYNGLVAGTGCAPNLIAVAFVSVTPI